MHARKVVVGILALPHEMHFDVLMVLQHSDVDGASIILILLESVCAELFEQLYDLEVPIRHSQVERGVSSCVFEVDLGSISKEDFRVL